MTRSDELAAPGHHRYALCVAYRGSHYHGWQRQPHATSVQQHLEQALSEVADHEITVITAGRTDSGVHASGQFVHFDSRNERSNYAWVRGTNTHLPADIRVNWATPVAADFHARFAAVKRSYRFIIHNNPVASACLHDLITWHPIALDEQAMQAASVYFLGEQDFSAIRAAGCQAFSPIRTIHHLEISRYGEFVAIDVTANAFLQHMVRNIAGILLRIGEGKESPQWAQQLLQAADRRHQGVTAPPHGLYLTDVQYPAQFSLPATPPPCRFW